MSYHVVLGTKPRSSEEQLVFLLLNHLLSPEVFLLTFYLNLILHSKKEQGPPPVSPCYISHACFAALLLPLLATSTVSLKTPLGYRHNSTVHQNSLKHVF